jgi:hypothetical protein
MVIRFSTSFTLSIFYLVFLPPLFQAFHEAQSVVVAEPEVFALVFVAAGLAPEVVVSAAGPEVFALVFVVAEPSPEAVSVAAELSPEVAVSAAGPEVFAPVFAAAEFFVEVVFAAEPQASVDIAAAFVVLVPASVVVGVVDSSERPRFPAFPNGDHFSSSSSSVEVVD